MTYVPSVTRAFSRRPQQAPLTKSLSKTKSKAYSWIQIYGRPDALCSTWAFSHHYSRQCLTTNRSTPVSRMNATLAQSGWLARYGAPSVANTLTLAPTNPVVTMRKPLLLCLRSCHTFSPQTLLTPPFPLPSPNYIILSIAGEVVLSELLM